MQQRGSALMSLKQAARHHAQKMTPVSHINLDLGDPMHQLKINTMNLILFTITWLGWSMINGLIGRKRFIGFTTAFWMSFFLSPLVGFFISIASSLKNNSTFIK